MNATSPLRWPRGAALAVVLLVLSCQVPVTPPATVATSLNLHGDLRAGPAAVGFTRQRTQLRLLTDASGARLHEMSQWVQKNRVPRST